MNDTHWTLPHDDRPSRSFLDEDAPTPREREGEGAGPAPAPLRRERPRWPE